jgi:hypothetical protein
MAVEGYTPADRGLVLDYSVQPTIEDVLSGRDAELEFVIDLIRQQESRD